ncbi:Uncharacterised protein [Serratia plymuthica]|uniref:Ferrichrome outer membrane transporter n=1 Tax=Serratia plymuthica TaxID=82996 RepID=A0A2X4V1W8_SERPL|nr:Uncharacterised protein [Serratia plymuthica]
MPTKRPFSPQAMKGRSPVSGLAITIAAALGTLAMPAFSAEANPVAKEDTLTVVGSSQPQQESAWGAGRHLRGQTQRHRYQNRYAD